jgi:foldase protein PrsA
MRSVHFGGRAQARPYTTSRLRDFATLRYAFLCLICAGMVTACGGNPPPTDPQVPPTVIPEAALTSPPPVESPTEVSGGSLPVNEAGETLVARVNNEGVTQPEFNTRLERERRSGGQAADEAAFQATVLDRLIEQKLIEQAAAAQNFTVTDEEIDARIESYIEGAGGAAAFQAWLTQNQYASEAEFRAAEREALVTAFVRDSVIVNMPATVVEAHARHIVVSTIAEAEDVLRRLQAGEDFAALAAEVSLDVTSRDAGGDLGWFAQGVLFQPELNEVIFSLEPGSSAGPVPTAIGFHVVQLLEFRDQPVSDENRAALAQTHFNNWLETQFENATIERFI